MPAQKRGPPQAVLYDKHELKCYGVSLRETTSSKTDFTRVNHEVSNRKIRTSAAWDVIKMTLLQSHGCGGESHKADKFLEGSKKKMIVSF